MSLLELTLLGRLHFPHVLIHNSPLIPNSGAAPPQPAAGIAKWAFSGPTPAQAPNPLPTSGMTQPSYVNFQSPSDVMSPCVQEIRDGFFGLHQKADRIHQEMSAFGPEIQAHGIRFCSLEQISGEHTTKHEATEQKLRNYLPSWIVLTFDPDPQAVLVWGPVTDLWRRARS